jgi:hypothetical protein
MKHWNELTPLEQAHCIYSDMHKDAYGFRPRNDVSAWTLEDFEQEFEDLGRIINADMEREEKRSMTLKPVCVTLSQRAPGTAKLQSAGSTLRKMQVGIVNIFASY